MIFVIANSTQTEDRFISRVCVLLVQSLVNVVVVVVDVFKCDGSKNSIIL